MNPDEVGIPLDAGKTELCWVAGTQLALRARQHVRNGVGTRKRCERKGEELLVHGNLR